MVSFKIVFPTGYQLKDVLNDNLDLNLILDNGKVFFATVFTIENIRTLMSKDGTDYFWSSDLIIVKDLKKETIWVAVAEILRDGHLSEAFSEIGTIQTVFPNITSYDDIVDML